MKTNAKLIAKLPFSLGSTCKLKNLWFAILIVKLHHSNLCKIIWTKKSNRQWYTKLKNKPTQSLNKQIKAIDMNEIFSKAAYPRKLKKYKTKIPNYNLMLDLIILIIIAQTKWS